MHPVIHEIKEALHGFYPESEAGALAKLLLVEVLGFSTLELYGGKDKAISEKDRALLEDIVRRLQQNEPIQYILGVETFCGMEFQVDGNVLIPRPETQELVEWILVECKEMGNCRVLDVGTGSGCIAVSLARQLPEARVEAWDVSAGALQVASENASRNGVKVHFVERDVLAYVPEGECLDVMVSNPPYITADERTGMEANVLDWEPELALFVPDDDPLLFYRKIAALGNRMLRPGGMLFFEINRAYGADTVAMLKALGYTTVELRKDMSGNDRMIKAIK